MSWLNLSSKKPSISSDMNLIYIQNQIPLNTTGDTKICHSDSENLLQKSRLSEASDISSEACSVSANSVRKRHRLSFLIRKQKRSISSPMPRIDTQKSSLNINLTSSRLNRATTSFTPSVKVIPSKYRFKKYAQWKEVFEPEKANGSSTQDDFFESWMVKKFFSLARPRIRRKVMLFVLEKLSIILSLVEEEASKKSEDEKMSLMVNALNGYILSLRFGVSRINVPSPLKGKNTLFNIKHDHKRNIKETIKTNMLVIKENLMHFKLSAKELEKRRNFMKKGKRKKTKSHIKLLKLQDSAIDNLYESFVLYLIEMRQLSHVQGNTLSIDNFSSTILKNFQLKLETVLDENKSLLLASLSNILNLPKLKMFSLFLNKSTLESKLGEIIEGLKLSLSALIDIINEEHLKTFLQLANAKNLFSKKWSIDTITKQIIIDNTDIALKEDLKSSLENLYIQLEHIVVHVTDWTVKHLEKLLS